MPTCQNCHEKWSWKQTFKKSFTLDTAIPCPFCGEKQYLTSRARKRSALPAVIIPFIIFIPSFFGVSFAAMISIFVSVVIGFTIFYPLVIELSNEEEALW
ncbi:TIGR04104 family putative zinc finger protein [Virgibacillus kimchii]